MLGQQRALGSANASSSGRSVQGQAFYPRVARSSAPQRTRPRSVQCSAAVPELAEVAASVQGLVEFAASQSPAAFRPIVSTLGGDISSIVALSPTLPGLSRLAGLAYIFLSRPNPVWGVIDFYLLAPFLGLRDKWTSADFSLREKLGGGNFGVTFEGIRITSTDEAVSQRGKLSQDQKKRRVVLKRVNRDQAGGVRTDFLKAGTLAKGSAETGEVESYMCAKVKRNPLASACCAEYLGYFTVDVTDGPFTKGSQWLVWKFESDATLGDALDGKLGPFPACLEEYMLGRVRENLAEDKRDIMVIQRIMKQVLVGLTRLHDIGIVHRDVKPENLLVTVEGQVKMIDFGASVDMCTGINFNPLYGMLDPRYSPPEELVMPANFPRAPAPFVACILAPFAWLYAAPDLFDSYSAGILLMQCAVPELRPVANVRLFNTELRQFGNDLDKWRLYKGTRYDFSLLDRSKGAAWDLARALLGPRNDKLRGRPSTKDALRHRFFSS